MVRIAAIGRGKLTRRPARARVLRSAIGPRLCGLLMGTLPMSTMRFLRGACALLALAITAPAALADGSGTIDDATLSLTYTGAGPYFPANVVALCEPGTPLCDTFILTVNISDELRQTAGNQTAIMDITL